MVQVGEMAPDFTLKGNDDQEYRLSDFKGKKNVVLAFYPLDWSPVCTDEHKCFINDLKQFENLDAQVFGISVDSIWSHKAFAKSLNLSYPLLADFQPRGAVAQKFGLYLADKGITNRAVVVIDKSGIVKHVKVYDIPQVPDPKEIIQVLQQL